MSEWKSVSLGLHPQAGKLSRSIQDAYVATYIASGGDPRIAVFTRMDTKTGIETAYFTPAAFSLAAAFGAGPAEKPFQDGKLSLLVGDRSAIQLYDLAN